MGLSKRFVDSRLEKKESKDVKLKKSKKSKKGNVKLNW